MREFPHRSLSIDALTLLGIAVGLSMDAFAVAVATGIALGEVSARQTFRLAWHFGFFQFLMPVVGWSAGRTVKAYLGGLDHWIAFGLLAFVGGKMIYGGFRGLDDGARAAGDPTRGASLVLLSVATSLDALAVGLSLAALSVTIWSPAVVIGIVTAALTTAGMHLGKRLGVRFGNRMEIAGGVVLVAIGVKIILERFAR